MKPSTNAVTNREIARRRCFFMNAHFSAAIVNDFLKSQKNKIPASHPKGFDGLCRSARPIAMPAQKIFKCTISGQALEALGKGVAVIGFRTLHEGFWGNIWRTHA